MIFSTMDFSYVESVLRELWARSPASKMKDVDEDAALTYVKEALTAGRIHRIHGCLVMYDIGAEWYATREFLIEQLVVRLDSTAKPSEVPHYLYYLAKELGLSAVVAGDTQVGAMDKHYTNAGYTSIGNQFYRRVT